MDRWTPPQDADDHLRRLLNEWDPIGVADLVDDEYDCLVSPLLERLRDGADGRSIDEYLRRELTDHFGLSGISGETTAIAGRLIAWRTGAS